MTVPTYDQFIEPLLRLLAARKEGASTTEVYEVLADELRLTRAAREALLPSGTQPVFKNRIGWAQDRLKRAGLSHSPRRGVWQATREGQALVAKHKKFSEEQVERIAKPEAEVHVGSRRGAGASAASEPVIQPVDLSNVSPEERIDAAVAELRDSVGRDLLESIGRAPPAFFEKLVLDLLHAMGYGTDRSDLQRVGGSGDGGIDGIISLDRLGLEKVYVQAKRWKNTVGSPEIQGFMGALQLQAANKGVFITTSDFTKDARAAAAKARGSIVLVDGAQLTARMIDHGVGVSHKALRVPKVDSDYFEEG